jgi:hypothetical protein
MDDQAPATRHGRFSVTMSSSVTGELARCSHLAGLRAYAEAIRLLRERAGRGG